MSSVTAPQARSSTAPQARGVTAPGGRAAVARSVPVPPRVVPGRPPLRLVPAPQRRPGRTPFVALVVVLLSTGLVALLLLNTALSEGAFVESALEQRNAALADREQQLERTEAELSSPQALAKRARRLGMVPGGPPAFLDRESGAAGGTPQTSRGDASSDTPTRARAGGRPGDR